MRNILAALFASLFIAMPHPALAIDMTIGQNPISGYSAQCGSGGVIANLQTTLLEDKSAYFKYGNEYDVYYDFTVWHEPLPEIYQIPICSTVCYVEPQLPHAPADFYRQAGGSTMTLFADYIADITWGTLAQAEMVEAREFYIDRIMKIEFNCISPLNRPVDEVHLRAHVRYLGD